MSFRVWSSRLDSLTKLPRCQGRNLSTHAVWFSGWVASAARETAKSWCLVMVMEVTKEEGATASSPM